MKKKNQVKTKTKISTLLALFAIISTVTILISNICSIKLFSIFNIVLPTSALLFPISYILGDVLTEVYGYKQSRKIILIGFIANLFMVLFFQLSIILPSGPNWNLQQEYSTILGTTPRMFIASLSAYLIGSLSNAYSMELIKKLTKSKYLWVRTIGSTIVGELLDTLIFVFIAFYGTIDSTVLLTTIISQFVWKVSYEVLATPLTYLVVNKVKKYEQES